MSGGSFNYLCDREAKELTDRTLDLQEMADCLQAQGHQREADETRRMIGRINKFHDEIEARAKDLRGVWKAAEWMVSGDAGREALTEAVEHHTEAHPEGSYAPGLDEVNVGSYTGIAALMAHHGHTAQAADIAALQDQSPGGEWWQRTNLAPNPTRNTSIRPNPGGTMPNEREPATKEEYVAKAIHDKYCQFNDWTFIHSDRAQDLTVAQWALDAAAEWDAAHPEPTPEPLPKPESLTAGDFRWAEDTTEWAEQFERDELLWIVQTANEAIQLKDQKAEERKAHAEEEARWDKRRAELIEQFNGGPLQVTNGQPIPTMALQAVEYIIEQERKHEQDQA